ncbi:hypothetical protein CHS0354_009453 [Potamilus streckersoni]|uniref:HTH La-type RNA-binding domain-containing protein n=1 Tax=Potamilus streckersoni TaxID=2493646 RepID=A0AAE0TJS3_9BIVA|nr:hypothetical protein CHS0354_009453 [Potamilus streckersoni]
MTSDRGSTGEAEMPCDTSPVTAKSPGLNPNATEFLSHNIQTAASAGATSAGVDGSQWETAGLFNNTDYQYINGDLGDKLDATGTFSPPMSEESPPIPMQETEYTTDYSDNQDIIPDGEVLLDGPIPDDRLRHMLKVQLESYFSRENLSSDTYMQSQMDADQYVPITTVANLAPIHSLTNDIQLILDVLRECNNAQVDQKGEKVRPNHKRCIVILREVPNTTPIEDVEKLFSGEDCPKFVSCEFAHNDNWYVTFDSDAKAQEAYQYLREVVKTFLGKPIMARIKAKPLIRSTYIPRNKHYHQYQFQQPQHPQQQPATSQTQQEQEQAQQQQQPQQQQPFSYSQPFAFMPSVTQYINNQQTIPFYPPPNPLFQTWPTTTTTPMLDPSLVLAMNGYQATSVKLNHNSGTRHPPFSTMNRNRPQRMHRPNSSLDRNGHDSRFSHERPQSNNSGGNNSHKASPRGTVDSASSHQSTFHNRRGDNSHPHQKGEDSYSHLVHSSSTIVSQSQLGTQSSASQHSHNDTNNNNNYRQSSTETAPLSQRRSYKSRRRREEEGVRPSRLNSLHLSSRDARSAADQHFDYEPTSFPPLPGSNNNAASGDVFSSKLSDVVKGTAKVPVKDIKSMTITSPTVTTTSNLSPVNTSCTATPPVTVQSTHVTPTSTAPSTNIATSRNSVSPLSRSPSVPTSVVPSVALDYHHTNSPAHRPAKPTPTPTEGKSVETTLTVTNTTSTLTAISSSSFSAASSTQVKGEEKPIRLSYAQMVQKSKPIENCTPNAMVDKSGTDGDSNSGSEKGESTQQQANVNKPNHTLKEQSQSTLKTVSTNGRSAPSKDSYRKDSESREQRFSSGRRAKENRMEMRDRRERRRDRERDGRPGTTN